MGGAVCAAAAAAILAWVLIRSQERDRKRECMTRLSSFYKQAMHYRPYGGATALPTSTGRDFYDQLCRPAKPGGVPIIAPETAPWLLRCPYESPTQGAPTYRAPARDPNTLKPTDVLLCDDPASHPSRTIHVLLVGGDILEARPGDALYDRALQATVAAPRD